MFRIYISLFIFLFFSLRIVHAQSEYQKYCTSPQEESTQLVCALSKNLGVPPLKVVMAMTFAAIDMTGTYCNFSFTKTFIDARMKLYSDNETMKVVTHLVTAYKNKPPPGFTGDKLVFCHMQYETFGPRSDSPFFRR